MSRTLAVKMFVVDEELNDRFDVSLRWVQTEINLRNRRSLEIRSGLNDGGVVVAVNIENKRMDSNASQSLIFMAKTTCRAVSTKESHAHPHSPNQSSTTERVQRRFRHRQENRSMQPLHESMLSYDKTPLQLLLAGTT